MPKNLSARQERFIAEYLVDHNASAAARRAGYSEKTRGAQACRLMKDPRVAERIALGMGDMLSELNVGAMDTMRAHARVAFFDPVVLLDGLGRPVPLAQLDALTRKVLSVHYDLKESGPVVRVRQAPRNPALLALERRQAALAKVQREVLLMRGEEAEGEREGTDEVGHAPPVAPAAAAHVLDLEVLERARAMVAHQAAVTQAQPVNLASTDRHDAEPANEPASRTPVGPADDAAQGMARGASRCASEDSIGEADEDLAPDTNKGTAKRATRRSMKKQSKVAPIVPAALAPASVPASAQASSPDEVRARVEARVAAAATALLQAAEQSAAQQRDGAAPQAAQAVAPGDPAPPAQEDDYDFRKDPNWMWGGRVKPVPPPEKGWVELEAEANAQWRKQNAELFANHKHLRVRPGAAIMPARMEPGYNPPWLRRDRPAVGDPGPVFYDDQYDRDPEI